MSSYAALNTNNRRYIAHRPCPELQGQDHLKAADAKHVGTHGIRHRSALDIANSGIPVKVGMALTAHKTVAMFMRYVHTEDAPVRQAAELVAARRRAVVGGLGARSQKAPVVESFA